MNTTDLVSTNNEGFPGGVAPIATRQFRPPSSNTTSCMMTKEDFIEVLQGELKPVIHSIEERVRNLECLAQPTNSRFMPTHNNY